MTKTPFIVAVLAVAAILGAAYSAPAKAADCQYLYDTETVALELHGLKVQEIAADKLPLLLADIEAKTGDVYENVTRAFVVVTPDGRTLLGLEQDGCLLPAIEVGGISKGIVA